MKKFSEFCLDFNSWKNQTNISMDEVDKYFFKFPQKALDKWKYEYENSTEDPDPQMIEMFHSMLSINSDIMGFKLAGISDIDEVQFFKISTEDVEFAIPDFLTYTKCKIVEDNELQLPKTILPGSVKFTSGFDCFDQKSKNNMGIIFSNTAFELGTNYQENNSIFGLVNYSTGEIELVNTNSNNDTKFENYYKIAKETVENKKSETDIDEEETEEDIEDEFNETSEEILDEIEPYEYISITGTCKKFAPPIEKIYSYSIND